MAGLPTIVVAAETRVKIILAGRSYLLAEPYEIHPPHGFSLAEAWRMPRGCRGPYAVAYVSLPEPHGEISAG